MIYHYGKTYIKRKYVKVIEWPGMLLEKVLWIYYTQSSVTEGVFQTPGFLFSLRKKFIVNYIEHGWVPPSLWPGEGGGGSILYIDLSLR